jgi:hypothetical protein
MVPLKLTKAQMKKRDKDMRVGPAREEEYTWGTRLCFSSEDVLEKIPGMSELKFGDTVSITAKGKVIEIVTTERNGEKSHRLEIQITHIGLPGEGDSESLDRMWKEKD